MGAPGRPGRTSRRRCAVPPSGLPPARCPARRPGAPGHGARPPAGATRAARDADHDGPGCLRPPGLFRPDVRLEGLARPAGTRPSAGQPGPRATQSSTVRALSGGIDRLRPGIRLDGGAPSHGPRPSRGDRPAVRIASAPRVASVAAVLAMIAAPSSAGRACREHRDRPAGRLVPPAPIAVPVRPPCHLASSSTWCLTVLPRNGRPLLALHRRCQRRSRRGRGCPGRSRSGRAVDAAECPGVAGCLARCRSPTGSVPFRGGKCWRAPGSLVTIVS